MFFYTIFGGSILTTQVPPTATLQFVLQVQKREQWYKGDDIDTQQEVKKADDEVDQLNHGYYR